MSLIQRDRPPTIGDPDSPHEIFVNKRVAATPKSGTRNARRTQDVSHTIFLKRDGADEEKIELNFLKLPRGPVAGVGRTWFRAAAGQR